MKFTMFLKFYIITIPIFFVVDMIWLGLVAKGFYKKYLGFLMRPQVNWTAAVIFYFLFIIGIIFFAVQPALQAGSWSKALVYGALFGFFTYATYDLTNLATIKDWPLIVTVIDIIWGSVLSGMVATASYLIGKSVLY
ncbi:MAG: DUF2177 family protein [bacterium]